VDISAEMVNKGHAQYGFVPVTIAEAGRLPFEDGFFDVVYCSSVIEHVTVPKERVWAICSGSEFRRAADERQRDFAQEIRRLGKRYFVQTPNKWFPIESHSWLPFIGYLPRGWQLPILRISNRVWVKRTNPDWRLLTAADMRGLFPDAVIERERLFGMTKSIMAIKR
jgi:SAM-dependent methyltransferase